MDPNKIIGVFAVAIAPVVIATEFAHNAKKTVSNKIEEVKCEMHNRRHYDKIHNRTRSSKK
jgi:hypothetical protein